MLTRYPPRHPIQVEHARQAASAVLGRWGGAPAYLSGACFAGLGTPASDVDLFVVRPGHVGTEQVFVGGLRVDVEFVDPGQLAGMVKQSELFTLDEGDMRQLKFAQYPVLDKLVRLILGEVLADDGMLEELRARADRADAEIRKLIVARMAVAAANGAEDVRGAVAIGDRPSAHYLARNTLLFGAEALLAARGDAYLGFKWVWSRWARTIGHSLGTGVHDLLQAPVADPEEYLWLAQDLLIRAMVAASHPVVCGRPPDPPRRNPYVMPQLTRGPVLLNRLDRTDSSALRVSQPGAQLWAAAHGRPRHQAVSLVSDILGVRPEDVDSYYGRLVDANVVLVS